MARIVLCFIKVTRYPTNGMLNITVPSTCSASTGSRYFAFVCISFCEQNCSFSSHDTMCYPYITQAVSDNISCLRFSPSGICKHQTSCPDPGSIEPDRTTSVEIPVLERIKNSRPAIPNRVRKRRPAFSAVFIDLPFFFI